MRILFRLLLLTLGLGVITLVAGQTGSTIVGQVTDETGVTLPGAIVQSFDPVTIQPTDRNGQFRIQAKENAQVHLRVSFLGYYTCDTIIERDTPLKNRMIAIRLRPLVMHLHEVVVCDRYSDRKQKEEPLGIEIADREYLLRNLSGSLMKSLDRLPGVNIIEIGSGQSKPMIRGLGFNRVVVADQGIKHQSQQWGADHGLEIDQFEAERIEVIKGPVSLRYGSDAIGGLIDISQESIPVPQSLNADASLSARTGSGALAATIGLQTRREHWYMKGRLSLTDYADYKIPVDTVTVNSYRVPLVDGRLRNTAGGEYDLHLTTGIVSSRFRSSLYVSGVVLRSGLFANAQGLSPLTTDSTYDVSFRDIQLPYQWVRHVKLISRTLFWLSDAKVTVDAGFQDNLRREYNKYIGHGYMPAILPDSLGFRSDLAREFDLKTVTLNISSAFSVAESHSWIAGINAEALKNRSGGWSFIIPGFSQVSSGIYLVDEIRIDSGTVIRAGIRFDIGHLNILAYDDWFPTPFIDNNDTSLVFLRRSEELHRTWGTLSWSAGISRQLGHLTLKANFGKGFRVPSPQELSVNGINYHYYIYEKGNSGLKPESSYQLDAGIEWQSGKLAAMVSPFLTWFPNYIFLNPDYTHDLTYGAGNQVYRYLQQRVIRAGGECHIHYHISGHWMAGFIAEYAWSRQLSGDKKGFTLPFSPPLSGVLNLKYYPPSGKILRNTNISFDMKMVASQNQIVPPERKTPGHISLDLAAGTDLIFIHPSLTFFIRVENLLNSVYYDHTSFYRLMDVPQPGRNLSILISMKL